MQAMLSKTAVAENTIEGAKLLIEYSLRNQPVLLEHTYSAVKTMEELVLGNPHLTEQGKANLIMATYLHKIGLKQSMIKPRCHSFQGYEYLLKAGWNEKICSLVLLHDFEASIISGNWKSLENIIKKANSKVGEYELLLIQLVDFTTDNQGFRVTPGFTLDTVENKYGVRSKEAVSARNVHRSFYSNRNILRLMMTHDLDRN